MKHNTDEWEAWRCATCAWRCDKRSSVRKNLCISGYENHRSCRPYTLLKRPLQASCRKKDSYKGGTRLFIIRGNQMGLATGWQSIIRTMWQREWIGAVMGAQKRENVIKRNLGSGDIIVLLGGRTRKGRYGCGFRQGWVDWHLQGAWVQSNTTREEYKDAV